MRHYQPGKLPMIGLIAITLTAFGCSSGNEKQETTSISDTASVANRNEHNAAVTDYVSFIGNDYNKMTLDHEYTNLALLKLNDAVQSFSTQIGYDVKGDLTMSKKYADMITHDPYETTHADNIRKSADILATILQNMQMAKFPALGTEATAVKDAAAAIDPNTLTLQQKEKVKAFFKTAADILSKMN